MNKNKWKPTVIIQTYKDRQASCQRLPDWKCSNTTSLFEDANQPTTAPHAVAPLAQQQSVLNGGPPPPPPPMPSDTNTKLSTKPKAPPVPQKTVHQQQQPLPPPCPSPDYDTLSIHSALSNTLPRHSPGARRVHSANRSMSPGALSKDGVDMESLESFKLNNPSAPDPKPPSTYFNKTTPTSPASSGKSTLKKTRPVSVTIGEYPSGTNRRPPSKFDFLTNGNADHVAGTPITSRLQSELVQTLSRSNLKKRTEMHDRN